MSKPYETMSLIPYVLIDGVPTLKDSQFIGMINRTAAEGTWDTIFYHTNGNAHTFLNKVKTTPNMAFYTCYWDDKPVCFAYIDSIHFDSGHLHFCIFKDYWKYAREITDFCLEQFLKHYSVLIGIIPEDNRAAIRFSNKSSFTKMGSIPDYFYNAKTQSYVNGMLYVKNRG